MDSRLSAAAEWLRGRLPHPPLVGVILGSGPRRLRRWRGRARHDPVRRHPGIPGVGRGRALGDARGRARCAASRPSFSRGASTTTKGTPMPAVVFPARVLGLLGCRTVIVTNAAGGIDKSFKSGNLMLIEDHINAFGTNPLVGRERRRPRAALPGHVGRLPQGPPRARARRREAAANPAEARRLRRRPRPLVRDAGRDPGLPRAGARTRSACPRCPRSSRSTRWASASSASRASRTWPPAS